MLERAGTLLPAVLAGVHFITCGGTLESSMTASHPLLVLDDALCGMALRLARGIEVNDETLALDLIKEVGWQDQYLDKVHTAEHCRQEYFFSKLLRRDPREARATPAGSGDGEGVARLPERGPAAQHGRLRGRRVGGLARVSHPVASQGRRRGALHEDAVPLRASNGAVRSAGLLIA
jgi:hypothetical protein